MQHSEEVVKECGVPQGSKLEPILFIIYANEMTRALKGNSTFAYADDTAIVVADKNVENAISVLQDQLNTAATWRHDNGLATKTKIMHIKPPHLSNSDILIKFHINDCIHKRAKTVTYLMILVAQLLNK